MNNTAPLLPSFIYVKQLQKIIFHQFKPILFTVRERL